MCFCLLQRYDAEEQQALKSWNDKWETQVAPYIAQCEEVTVTLTDLCIDWDSTKPATFFTKNPV